MKDYTNSKELRINASEYFSIYRDAHDQTADEYPMTIDSIMSEFEHDAMESGDFLGETQEDIKDTLLKVRIHIDAMLNAWKSFHAE